MVPGPRALPGPAARSRDQGADDFLDSDPDPATFQTTFIGPTLTDADETHWSAGIGPGNGQTPPTQEVLITGMRHGNSPSTQILLDVQDPNPPGSVTGYNVYRSTSAALPVAQWDMIVYNAVDQDPETPDIQFSYFSLPPVGGCYFYKVTGVHSTCNMEGPR